MSTTTPANGRLSPATHTTSHLLPTDINSADFAPFGEVIQNPMTHGGEPKLDSVKANQGSATKWLDVTHLNDYYEFGQSGKAAKVVFNMFVCEPRELESSEKGMVFPVRIIERHPFTAQTFIPIGVSPFDENARYLVIVAPTLPSNTLTTDRSSTSSNNYDKHTTGPARKGPGPPDLDNMKAFIAKGDQAVTYSAGTWHAPMVVLGQKAIDFVVVQYSNGVASEDCEEFETKPDDNGNGLGVVISPVGGVKAKL